MSIVSEQIRLHMQEEINEQRADRAKLEQQHGQVWNTEELTKDFAVVGFMAPFVVVRRRADNKLGTLLFQHHPRFYFSWKESGE